MPGYGSHPGAAPHRIDLAPFDGSDNWVDIRPSRTSGAATRVQSALLEIGGVAADGTAQLTTRANLTEARLVLFEGSILAWSLKADDADAEPMPLTRTVFADVLDGDVGNFLDGEITRYYARRRLSPEAAGN